MRLRVILIGMSLLMFIFCAFNPSQAALDEKYYSRLVGPADEHPWQYDDTPIVNENLNRFNSPSVILPFYPLMKAILLIQVTNAPSTTEKAKPKATVFQGDEQHLNGPK